MRNLFHEFVIELISHRMIDSLSYTLPCKLTLQYDGCIHTNTTVVSVPWCIPCMMSGRSHASSLHDGCEARALDLGGCLGGVFSFPSAFGAFLLWLGGCGNLCGSLPCVVSVCHVLVSRKKITLSLYIRT